MITASEMVSKLTQKGFFTKRLNSFVLLCSYYEYNIIIKYTSDTTIKRWYSYCVPLDRELIEIQEMEAKQTKNYLYIISNGENVKIGISQNPEQRLKQLQTSCAKPLKLLFTVEGGRSLEKKLHKMLWQFKTRYNGEWFKLSSETLSFVYSYCQNQTFP